MPVQDSLPASADDGGAEISGSTPAQGDVASIPQHHQPAPTGTGQSQAFARAAPLGSSIGDATPKR